MGQTWLVLLLLLALVQIGVSVVLVLVCLRAKVKNREGPGRPNTSSRDPKPAALAVLLVGPAEPILVRPSATEPLTIGPSREETVIGPTTAITIEPPQRAAWDDRGWARRRENGEEVYEGLYQVADRGSGQRRRFRGRILVKRGEVLPYIADPPAELRRHPKSPCFQLSHPPWFKMHWHRAAGNVDDALLYVEKIIDEAVNGRHTA